MSKKWFHAVVIPAKSQSDVRSTAKIEGSGATFDSIKVDQTVMVNGECLSVSWLCFKDRTVKLSDGKTYKVQKIRSN